MRNNNNGLRLLLYFLFHLLAFEVFAEQPLYVSESLYLDGHFHRYAVVLPESNEEKPPVILFLHGSGERGQDLDLVTSVAVPVLKSSMPNTLIVAPQVRKNKYWSDQHYMALALATLKDVISKYSTDEKRIFLTGLSMGGHGAIHLAANHPEKFAAVAAICPRLAQPAQQPGDVHIPSIARALAERLDKMPLWLFHGENDTVTPAENSRELFDALQQKKSPVLYTELEGGGHNIWNTVYNGQALSNWLFKQTLH